MTSANQPGAPPLRVFLCHASEDKAAVRKLRRKLQQSGIDPWMDENKLLPGQQWQDEITRALRTCDAVLVCISRGSLTKEGFLQREIRIILEIADEKPDPVIFLIPVLLEKLNREELPTRLTKFEYTNLFERGAYGRLLAALRLRAENLDRILPHSLKKRTSLPEKMCILEIADSFWQNWPQVPEPVRTELAKFIESLVMDPITLDILSFGKSKSKISAKKLLLLRNLSRSVEGMKNTYVYRLNYREESITCTGNCV